MIRSIRRGVHVSVCAALVLGLTGSSRSAGESTGHSPSPVGDLELPAGFIDNLPNGGADDFEAFARDAKRPLGTPSKEITVKQSACDTKIIMTVFQRAGKISHHGDFKTDGGVLLAKIQNTSTSCNFTLIGLRAQHTAYWVVDLDKFGIYRSRFVDITGFDTEIGKNSGLSLQECPQDHSNSAEGAMVQERSNICSHYFVQAAPGVTVADPSLARAEFVNYKSVVGSKKAIRRGFDDPSDPLLWFTCAGGCCYADF